MVCRKVLNGDGGIAYENFEYDIIGFPISQIGGVGPKSKPNVAVLIPDIPGAWKTNGRCFALKTFHFGCSPRVTCEVAAPVSCDLFLRAFDGQDKAIGEQFIRFDPNGLLLADMTLATVTLPPAKVIELDVRYPGGNVVSGLTVAEFDDVHTWNMATMMLAKLLVVRASKCRLPSLGLMES